MIEAQKEQRLSLENYKQLFSLYEKVPTSYTIIYFFNRWAFKFLKRFPDIKFDGQLRAEILSWDEGFSEQEIKKFSNYPEIYGYFNKFKNLTIFRMFPQLRSFQHYKLRGEDLKAKEI